MAVCKTKLICADGNYLSFLEHVNQEIFPYDELDSRSWTILIQEVFTFGSKNVTTVSVSFCLLFYFNVKAVSTCIQLVDMHKHYK